MLSISVSCDSDEGLKPEVRENKLVEQMYEIAVAGGYTGTLEQWIKSLKGEKGDTGPQGQQGPQGKDGKSAYQIAVEHSYTGTEQEWLESLRGKDGKSAYQITVEHGYTGTEQEWLKSLKAGKEYRLFYIPDDIFRDYLRSKYPDAFLDNISNILDYDNSKIKNETKIDVSNKGIESLKGIEYFTNLKTLNCSKNKISSVDISKNKKLTYLDIYENKLKNLDVTNNTALEHLSFSHNQLTGVDLSKNTNLKQLWCTENELNQLDLSKNTALAILGCWKNKLEGLDLSNNPHITHLYCQKNKLEHLNLTAIKKHPSKVLLEIYYNENKDEQTLKQIKLNKRLKQDREIKEVKKKDPRLFNICLQ